MKWSSSLFLAVLASAATAVLAASPASAHTSLIDVQPGEGTTVGAGTTVILTFSEALLELGTEISVTDASGEPVSLEVQRPEPPSVAATLPALVAGPVTVSWRVVSGDGHPIEGMLSYVAEGAGSSASNPASSGANDPPTAVTEKPDATAAPQPTSELVNGGLSILGWLGIGAVILAAAGVGVLAKKRR